MFDGNESRLQYISKATSSYGKLNLLCYLVYVLRVTHKTVIVNKNTLMAVLLFDQADLPVKKKKNQTNNRDENHLKSKIVNLVNY